MMEWNRRPTLEMVSKSDGLLSRKEKQCKMVLSRNDAKQFESLASGEAGVLEGLHKPRTRRSVMGRIVSAGVRVLGFFRQDVRTGFKAVSGFLCDGGGVVKLSVRTGIDDKCCGVSRSKEVKLS